MVGTGVLSSGFKARSSIKVTIGGTVAPVQEVFEVVTDSDIDLPDMAAVTLVNVRGGKVGTYSTEVKEGDALIIQADGKDIFKGDIIGLECTYDYDLPSRVVIRGLNRMHR